MSSKQDEYEEYLEATVVGIASLNMGNMASASAKPSGSAVSTAAIAASSDDTSDNKPGMAVVTKPDAAASKPEPPKPKAPILKATDEEAKPSAAAARAPSNNKAREWREKKRLHMFSDVLLACVARDVATHAKAKAIIQDYLETSIQAGQPYQDLISSTKVRLHLAVGEVHWKKAHAYLHQELIEMVNLNKKELAASVKTTLSSKKKKAATGKAKTVKKKGGSAKAKSVKRRVEVPRQL